MYIINRLINKVGTILKNLFLKKVCQTGISSFVVTHDGQIKLCELGKPYNFNLNILVKYFREYERMKEEFCNVTFQKLWRKDDSENEKHYLGKKE